MTLIARVSTDETIHNFRRAAGARYAEGSWLATHGDRLASIYLLGYSAEMLLKAAFFRLEGYGPGDPLPLKSAPAYARSWGLAGPRNLHDLPWWATLLVERRKLDGRPYPLAFSSSLVANVNHTYRNWREYLRYRTNRPTAGEVAEVRHSVTWLMGQYRFLY